MSGSDLSALPGLAAELGVELGAAQCRLLADYLDRIYLWNRSAGLTTVDPQDAPRLHLLDSLTVLPLLGAPLRLVDLGTGAGLPGIVLAIANDDLQVDLVETARKKANFLREAVRELGLGGRVRVLQRDAADLEDRYPAVVARAFRHPDEYLDHAWRIVAPGGIVLVMGARLPDAEVRSLQQEFADRLELVEDRALQLPGGPERRRLLLWKSLIAL